MQDTPPCLQLSDFDGLVNETFVFWLEGDEQRFEGLLIKAEPIKSDSHPDAQRSPFFLEFKFPAGTNIGQSMLQVETAKGHRFPPMFLVPRGSDANGWYMDATFN